MKHRMAFAAMAACASIAGACADRDGGDRLMTEPSGGQAMVRYVTTSGVGIVNPRTHRLESVSLPAPQGVSASVNGGSGVDDAMQISSTAPGVARTGGKASWTFTDDTKHVQKIVLLYRAGGGPPAAMQHYTDGALVSTTAYTWGRTSMGWVRTSSLMQSVRNGVLVGTYSTTTVPTKPGSGGGPIQTVRLDRAPAVSPLRRAIGSVAYALAFAFAPQDATAQFYFYACRLEWLRYAGAAALLVGAGSALAAAPEFTPLLLTAFIGALTTAAAFEDVLIDCMLAHESLATGGFGAGGGSTWPSGKWDCFEGSYAAHCTTAFTI
ncbi:MAG TPA: hypothetical protein VGO46_12970 [Gemmatimonadaceae bacterium]|jgi:hypothetical protein|nr:hypothetical protein [Gemmatimonadaceae bacterium]